MRPIPAEPPPFFRRGPSPLARLTFFGLASIVLLFADARFRYLEDLRHAFSHCFGEYQECPTYATLLEERERPARDPRRTLIASNMDLRQLKTAEDIAKKTGRAVAIGHPYQETLEALRLWRTARDPGVAMVSLRRVPAEVD